MNQEFIPENVQQFILKRIDSVAYLEALLLLRREPTGYWTDEALGNRLYIDTNQAAAILARLRAEGFVTTRSTKPLAYEYQPGSSELAQMVDVLARHFCKVPRSGHKLNSFETEIKGPRIRRCVQVEEGGVGWRPWYMHCAHSSRCYARCCSFKRINAVTTGYSFGVAFVLLASL